MLRGEKHRFQAVEVVGFYTVAAQPVFKYHPVVAVGGFETVCGSLHIGLELHQPVARHQASTPVEAHAQVKHPHPVLHLLPEGGPLAPGKRQEYPPPPSFRFIARKAVMRGIHKLHFRRVYNIEIGQLHAMPSNLEASS